MYGCFGELVCPFYAQLVLMIVRVGVTVLFVLYAIKRMI